MMVGFRSLVFTYPMTYFDSDEHTEDLLDIHEEEIARLKEERRSKAPLLVSIRKYYQICEEQKELEVGLPIT
jgi:hypothetical protein